MDTEKKAWPTDNANGVFMCWMENVLHFKFIFVSDAFLQQYN